MITWLVNFVEWSPLLSIILFSFIISFLINWVYSLVMDKEKNKRLKEKQKELQEEIKKNKDDPKKLGEIQGEMMQNSSELLKMTFKPMLITTGPLLLIFYFLKTLYVEWAQIGNIIPWGKPIPIFGDGAGWFLCYIVFGMIFSILTKKIFKL